MAFNTPNKGWWCCSCEQYFEAGTQFYGCKICEYNECDQCAKSRKKRPLKSVPVRTMQQLYSDLMAPVPSSSHQGCIPKVLHFTSKSLSACSPEVIKHLTELSEAHPDFTVRFWGDAEVNKFMKTHCSRREYLAFCSINRRYGPAVADHFRYKVLQVHGGVYLDLKAGWNKITDKVRHLGPMPPIVFTHWG